MSTGIAGLVETSNNLATISIENHAMRCSLASAVRSCHGWVIFAPDRIDHSACGRHVVTGDGYPSWEPNWKSSLLEKCKRIYKKKFGKDPVVEVIHAGLECGIIGTKYHGMEMISFGPTIRNPHTPTESLCLTDLEKSWDLLVEILASK